jgi:diguanylate cyclase (GGDEF)-like protein
MMTTFNRRILTWFLLTCLILLGLCYASYRSIDSLLRQNGWVEHTYEVLMLLDETLLRLKEIQTAARGYVLIGQPRFRDMAEQNIQQIQLTLNELSQATHDNPTQVPRIPKLRTAVDSVNDFAEETIVLYERSGQKAAVAQVATGIGQQRLDGAQEIINAIRSTETELLTQRRLQVQQAITLTFAVGSIGIVCCFFIIGMVFWLIERETKRRSDTEASLHTLLHSLEALSEERAQIAQMGDFLQSCRTPAEAYQLIQQNLPKMFLASHGGVGVTSNSRNAIDIVANWGNMHSTLQQFQPEDCWAMRRGKVHTVGTAAGEPDCAHLSARMPDYVCVPLMAHGETLGVLYIASEEAGYFTEHRQQLLRTVCEQISLALANMKLQETLRMQTLRDPLTQLYNRRYMESSLERELLRARRNDQPLTIMMLDVDHFKRFNDTFGHDAGDALLKQFGQLLQRNVRGEDIACRYGGEEFILILPTCPPEIAIRRAEKIIEETRQLSIVHDHQPLGKISVSIGIAQFPDHADAVDTLVKAADRALYRAKSDGRDQWVAAA